ncbi:MAG: glucose-6-phosphate isomerase, partial [Sediminibacterium sp.]|nr:glucose-6-phosphate isomerase [Sediminibacterium sp.]
IDFSKTSISQKIKNTLINLAEETQLAKAIEDQFGGQKINETEQRAVLHTALRANKTNKELFIDGQNIYQQIGIELNKLKHFSAQFHAGQICGCTNKPFKYIVNIGIGGSDLGPAMVTGALRHFWKQGLKTYFVSNVDRNHLEMVLKEIQADETLFIIASKTFTTQETMANAAAAKVWFKKYFPQDEKISQHFVALSTNSEAVKQFGIKPEFQFEFWDWVGGRFSLWSAIGLSIILSIGYENFEQLLAGAQHADEHFRSTEFKNNIPVMMALTGIWHINFCGYPYQAILPYSQLLDRFPAYLQQAIMESNGKTVDRFGKRINYHTGPIIFGEPGTNGQHAFYQLIHQGTQIIPCDFIGVVNDGCESNDQQEKLFANFIAQTEALLQGSIPNIDIKDTEHVNFINLFKEFSGNRPTTSIVLKELTPYNVGKLIAYYEHQIFVQGIIWNIYSYDQYGVELGKKLAQQVLQDMKQDNKSHDISTVELIKIYQRWKKKNLENRFLLRVIEPRDNKTMASIIRDSLTEHGANKPGTVFTDPTTDNICKLFLDHQPSVYYVVEDTTTHEIVGGCGIFPTPNLPPKIYELVKLYIRNDYRGFGIAKELMTKCENQAKQWGLTGLYIETMSELGRAVVIYEKIGYKYIQQSLGASGHCSCNIFMLKNLVE